MNDLAGILGPCVDQRDLCGIRVEFWPGELSVGSYDRETDDELRSAQRAIPQPLPRARDV